MTTKHTPGPWEVVRTRDNLHVSSIDRKTDEPDGIIASVKILAWCNRQQENANARLIAAAPDLLEACKALLMDSGCPIGHQKADRWAKACDLAREALRKAEGEDGV